MLRYVLVSLAALLILSCGTAGLISQTAHTPTPEATAAPSREEQHYMTLYQGCVLSLLAVEYPGDIKGTCNSILLAAYWTDTYDVMKEPKNWEWPLPDAPETPEPSVGSVL